MTDKYPCIDCGVDVLQIGDWYMALPDLWEDKLGLTWDDNLCIACLDKRLGHRAAFPTKSCPPVRPLM